MCVHVALRCMPLSNVLASMRLMSEELLPALHAAKPTPLEQITAL
jgi:hypothetical protein